MKNISIKIWLAVAMLGLTSACTQTGGEQAGLWDKSYDGVASVSVSRVPTMGPSAGIF